VTDRTAAALVEQVRTAISKGALRPGDALPSVTDWEAEGFGRGASQHALQTLRAEGLITSRKGSGSYVRDHSAIQVRRTPGPFTRLGSYFSGREDSGAIRPLGPPTIGEQPAPADIADLLQITAGDPVLCRVQVSGIEGSPARVTSVYLPLDLVTGATMPYADPVHANALSRLSYTDPGPAGIFGRLADAGWLPDRFHERVTGRGPTHAEADALGISRTSGRVFQVLQTTWSGPRRIMAARIVLDQDRFALDYSFHADDEPFFLG